MMGDPSDFAYQPRDQANANGPPATGGDSSYGGRKVKYYDIYDRHEKKTVGRANSLKAALRSVDRRDNAYGGYRYTHKAVYED